MRKILLTLMTVTMFLLVGCNSKTSSTEEHINPNILVQFSFEILEEYAEIYDLQIDTYYVDDVFTIKEVRILVSETGEPDEWEEMDSPRIFSDVMRDVFSDIRDDEAYANQAMMLPLNETESAIIKLENESGDEQIHLHVYCSEGEETTNLSIYFFKDSYLYFYYDFETTHHYSVLNIINLL